MSLQEAFNQVCKEAKTPKGFYVSLMQNSPFYGGPEEGGWWGTDQILVAYQYYDTEEAAETAKEAIEVLAVQLSDEARKAYGDYCLRQCAYLDERGLDDNFFREVDGEISYFVVVSEEFPQNNIAERGWE